MSELSGSNDQLRKLRTAIGLDIDELDYSLSHLSKEERKRLWETATPKVEGIGTVMVFGTGGHINDSDETFELFKQHLEFKKEQEDEFDKYHNL
jgi:hypothetical protein